MSLWEKFKDQHSPYLKKKMKKKQRGKPTSKISLENFSPKKETKPLIFNHEVSTYSGCCHHLFDDYSSNGKRTRTNQISRRRRRSRLGLSIAHKHLTNGNNNKCLYRKREDWSGPQNYTAVEFLANDTRAMGIDVAGKLDVIDIETNKPLITDWEIQSSTASSSMKFKSLGSRAVVGMPSGNYKVLDLERQSSIEQYSISSTMVNGPRRRYHRDFKNPRLRLQSMLTTAYYYEEPHEFREMYGWNTFGCSAPTAISFYANGSKQTQTQWGFCGQGTNTLAAHVDGEHDCFCLLPSSSGSTPTIIIDTSSQDNGPTTLEHISSVDFCGDQCLATSHVTWNGGMSNGVLEPSAEISNTIKLWDLRFLKDRQPLSAISVVPSFPNDSCVGKQPTLVKSILTNIKNSDRAAITNIHGTSRTLLVTTKSSNSTQNHFLDLGSLAVTKTISCSNQAVFGVADSQNAMVGWDPNDDSLEIYNLQASQTIKPLSGSKRSLTEDDDPSRTRIASLSLEDRHGCETKLTCLTMNESGTCILGGSVDGDLFAWR